VFVPDDFEPPTALHATAPSGLAYRLEPLGPEHNERDHRAWTTSIDHIRASPGFADRSWPHPMSLAENADDLAGHAADFAARRGFTYTVLDETDDVIGCVYIYPAGDHAAAGAHVRSWVRADHADLDVAVRATVAAWLRDVWPFDSVSYAGV
jgi:hypothetical protein